MALYITYDNRELTDGLGAQALRILGIYAISQRYRIKYIHSPIGETIEEFAHGIISEKDLLTIVNRVNDFFCFPSNVSHAPFDLEFRIRNLSRRQLARMMLMYSLSQKSVLLRVCLPFGITDRNPKIYKYAVQYLRLRNSRLVSYRGAAKIVLHFRMGYGQSAPIATHVTPRFLPKEYYLSVMEALKEKGLDQGVRNLIVHTDLSDKEVPWKPSAMRLQQNISFGEEIVDGTVIVPKNDVHEIFKSVEDVSVEVKFCADWIDTFIEMANADILILSRSAFSYLAALFNENLVIYPSNHGHSPQNGWVTSEDLGIQMNYKLIPG